MRGEAFLRNEPRTISAVIGSHNQFTKQGERTISVPTVKGRTVKRVYLDQVLERLGLNEGQA